MEEEEKNSHTQIEEYSTYHTVGSKNFEFFNPDLIRPDKMHVAFDILITYLSKFIDVINLKFENLKISNINQIEDNEEMEEFKNAFFETLERIMDDENKILDLAQYTRDKAQLILEKYMNKIRAIDVDIKDKELLIYITKIRKLKEIMDKLIREMIPSNLDKCYKNLKSQKNPLEIETFTLLTKLITKNDVPKPLDISKLMQDYHNMIILVKKFTDLNNQKPIDELYLTAKKNYDFINPDKYENLQNSSRYRYLIPFVEWNFRACEYIKLNVEMSNFKNKLLKKELKKIKYNRFLKEIKSLIIFLDKEKYENSTMENNNLISNILKDISWIYRERLKVLLNQVDIMESHYFKKLNNDFKEDELKIRELFFENATICAKNKVRGMTEIITDEKLRKASFFCSCIFSKFNK